MTRRAIEPSAIAEADSRELRALRLVPSAQRLSRRNQPRQTLFAAVRRVTRKHVYGDELAVMAGDARNELRPARFKN
jgi:hypothetical protein